MLLKSVLSQWQFHHSKGLIICASNQSKKTPWCHGKVHSSLLKVGGSQTPPCPLYPKSAGSGNAPALWLSSPLQQVGERAAGELMPKMFSSFKQKRDTEVAVSTSSVTAMLHTVKGKRWGKDKQRGFLLIMKSNRSVCSLA